MSGIEIKLVSPENFKPGTKSATLNIFLDIESSEGPKADLGGPLSIGMTGHCAITRNKIFGHEFVFTPLAGRYSERQVNRFWMKPENVGKWNEMKERAISRVEAESQLRNLIKELRDAGWTIVIYARPLAYDFRLLTQLFTTIGIEHAYQRFEVRGEPASTKEILDQVTTAWDISQFGDSLPPQYLELTKFKELNDNSSPFGFGGLTEAIDMAQIMVGFIWGIGVGSGVYFNDLMKKVLGRETTHNALADAEDQAAVWFAFEDLRNEFVAARATGNQLVVQQVIAKIEEFFKPLPKKK
jgi:hypothetical protein